MTNNADFKNKSQEQMIEYAVRMRKRAERAEVVVEELRKWADSDWHDAQPYEEPAYFGGVASAQAYVRVLLATLDAERPS